MLNLRETAGKWLPVLLWMVVIFYGSTDVLSSHRTSRFLVPFLRWLKPDISDATLQAAQYFVRKSGHMSEYAVLAALMWRAIPQPAVARRPVWRWSAALVVLGFSVLYAASDEIHQSLVRSRQGAPLDVLIDALGSLLGLTAVWIYCFCRRER